MECVNCGNRKLTHVVHRKMREVAGRVFTADLPARQCVRCGSEYFEGKDVLRWEREIVRDLVRHGPAMAESLSFIRRASGYKAVDVAELLGVTPAAVSRWERGRARFDRQTWLAIGRLAMDRIDGKTDTVDQLRALTRRPRQRVHLKVV